MSNKKFWLGNVKYKLKTLVVIKLFFANKKLNYCKIYK